MTELKNFVDKDNNRGRWLARGFKVGGQVLFHEKYDENCDTFLLQLEQTGNPCNTTVSQCSGPRLTW